MMGVMPLYGSQPVTEGEKGWLECDWFLCNQCYRTVIVEPWPFEHEWLSSEKERQVNDVGYVCLHASHYLHPQNESYKQDHPIAFKTGIIMFSETLLFV